MKNFINDLRSKNIHVVGVTGAEGSSILRFLVKHGIENLTVHDYTKKDELEKSFNLWHKGNIAREREFLYRQFLEDSGKAKICVGSDYLSDIDKAEIIFVPQSWRLYKKENFPLFALVGKIPFYSLTRLYLDFAPARIIAVSGTVGKGSTANMIYQILKNLLPHERSVYFAGNETWMVQSADKLDEMDKDDILVLEISHRQLQDGFNKAPNITVITNLYPNHLDEVTFDKYINLKLSLVKKQGISDTAILNYDIPDLRIKDTLRSKVIYFSQNDPKLNTKNIQRRFNKIMNIKSDQYTPNILASLTVLDILGIDIDQTLHFLPTIKPLNARLQLVDAVNEIKIYDDIKSTTPWATMAALNKLGKNTILICGGKTKDINYEQFAEKVSKETKQIIILKSELSRCLSELLSKGVFTIVDKLDEAIKLAYQLAKKGDNLLISPAAGFFYSDFIKGKKSIRRLVTSLLPKEQVLKDQV